MTKYALKIAREWSGERKQWGVPIGKHDPVAQKLAFIAGSAFGIEAVVDVSSRLADDKRNDIRIEAALAKLYASELGWQVIDTMVQVRGGRGYETAESLRRRGEKPVPAEQLLRDMRINRIFEGSTEIMHLLIAREAVDQHLAVAGDVLDPKTAIADKAKAAGKAGAFYAKWFPKLAVGEGMKPGLLRGVRPAGRAHALRRARLAQARAVDLLPMGRYQASLEQRAGCSAASSTSAPSSTRSRARACTRPSTREQPEPEALELADLFARQARRRADRLFGELWANDDAAQYKAAQKLLEGRYTWFEDDVLDPAGEGPMMPEHEPPARKQFEEAAT